eukprot:796834-Amphidinium_carterae.1
MQHALSSHYSLPQNDKVTKEIREFYDGFEVYKLNNEFNPNKPINEDEGKSTTLQEQGVSLRNATRQVAE